MAASTSQKSEQREWIDEECYKLIGLFEEEEVLYKGNAKNDNVRAARRAATERIASHFDNCTAGEVIRKWRNLQAHFNKIRRTRRASDDSEGVKPFVRWKFFRAMAFMDKYSYEPAIKGKMATLISETSEMSERSKFSSWSDDIDQQVTIEPKMTWTDKELYKLIDLYEEEEVLYNCTVKQYHNRDARRAAEERIAAHFGCTGADVTRKWRILMAHFNKCSRKIRALGDDVPVDINWKFYKAMSVFGKYKMKRVFNGDQHMQISSNAPEMVSVHNSEEMSNDNDYGEMEDSVCRNNSMSESSMILTDSHHDDSESQIETPDQISPSDYSELQFVPQAMTACDKSSATSTKKRQSRQNKESDIVQATCRLLTKIVRETAAETRRETLDDCAVFGNFVASELRKLDPDSIKKLKGDICTLILS